MKKKVISSVLAGVMVLGLAGCGGSSADSAAASAAESTTAASEAEETVEATSEAADESDLDYIKGKGTLVVGVTDFAPMDYKDDNGEWIGFDADLAKKVAEDLGVACEIVEIDWDNKIIELKNKSIDVVWNGMTLTNEVTNSMSCTAAYLENAQVVVVNADVADQYSTVESLAELNFAVEAGSAGEEVAGENGFNYNSVESQANALMEVKSGTSDACIIDLLMAGAMIGEGTDFDNLTYTVKLNSEEYGIGCRQGSDLAAFIDEALKGYETDGSLQTIAEQYGVQESLIALN